MINFVFYDLWLFKYNYIIVKGGCFFMKLFVISLKFVEKKMVNLMFNMVCLCKVVNIFYKLVY